MHIWVSLNSFSELQPTRKTPRRFCPQLWIFLAYSSSWKSERQTKRQNEQKSKSTLFSKINLLREESERNIYAKLFPTMSPSDRDGHWQGVFHLILFSSKEVDNAAIRCVSFKRKQEKQICREGVLAVAGGWREITFYRKQTINVIKKDAGQKTEKAKTTQQSAWGSARRRRTSRAPSPSFQTKRKFEE